jgi:hypothetical protein
MGAPQGPECTSRYRSDRYIQRAGMARRRSASGGSAGNITVSMSAAPGEWLVLVSGRDHRLAWPTGASLSANDHAIQQQFAAPDTPGFAARKRTIQAGGPSLAAAADPPGHRDAGGIVGEEQLGCHAARQSLPGDAGPQRRHRGRIWPVRPRRGGVPGWESLPLSAPGRGGQHCQRAAASSKTD